MEVKRSDAGRKWCIEQKFEWMERHYAPFLTHWLEFVMFDGMPGMLNGRAAALDSEALWVGV